MARRLDANAPILDARLADKSRVNIIIPSLLQPGA
jgi:Flp pilus assembly CpaF family ATPase